MFFFIAQGTLKHGDEDLRWIHREVEFEEARRWVRDARKREPDRSLMAWLLFWFSQWRRVDVAREIGYSDGSAITHLLRRLRLEREGRDKLEMRPAMEWSRKVPVRDGSRRRNESLAASRMRPERVHGEGHVSWFMHLKLSFHSLQFEIVLHSLLGEHKLSNARFKRRDLCCAFWLLSPASPHFNSPAICAGRQLRPHGAEPSATRRLSSGIHLSRAT